MHRLQFLYAPDTINGERLILILCKYNSDDCERLTLFLSCENKIKYDDLVLVFSVTKQRLELETCMDLRSMFRSCERLFCIFLIFGRFQQFGR